MWYSIFDIFAAEDAVNFIMIDGIHGTLKHAMDKVFDSSNALDEIYAAFASIGLLLLLVYFAMDLFDKLSSENFSTDTLILDMIKVVAGVALINNGFIIVKGLVGVSDWTCELIMDAIHASPTITAWTHSISGESLGNDTFSVIGNILEMLLTGLKSATGVTFFEKMIIGLIGLIGTQVVAYQRAVNLALRAVLCPFVFADIVGHGLTNKSMHYIKNILAICLEGPIIILVVAFVNAAMNNVLSQGIAFSALVLAFATISLMFGADKIAKEIVGG